MNSLFTALSDACGDPMEFKESVLARSLPDEAAVGHAFNALAEGGNIGMPLTKTFWSPRFGMGWMVTKTCLPMPAPDA